MQQKIKISTSYIIKRQKKIGNIVFSIDYKALLSLELLNKWGQGSLPESQKASDLAGRIGEL